MRARTREEGQGFRPERDMFRNEFGSLSRAGFLGRADKISGASPLSLDSLSLLFTTRATCVKFAMLAGHLIPPHPPPPPTFQLEDRLFISIIFQVGYYSNYNDCRSYPEYI